MLLNLLSGQAALERKLYGLVIARLDGDRIRHTSYGEEVLSLIRKGIGGFLLQGGEKDEIKAFLAHARSHGDRPLFFASSVDNGMSASMRGATHFPGPMAFAAASGSDDPGTPLLITRALAAMAAEAADLGINIPLMPQFPLQNPATPPEKNDERPLLQAALFDRLNCEYEAAFLNAGLTPWRPEALARGGFLYSPCLSDQNDRPLIRALIREDDSAASFASCIAAGGDLLIGAGEPEALVEALAHAFETRLVTEERLDQAFLGVEALKVRIGRGYPAAATPVDYERNSELAQEIAQKAVTLVKGRGRFMPVRDSDRLPLIYGGGEEHFLLSHLRYYVSQASHEKKPLPTHERPVVFLLFGGREKGNGEEIQFEKAEQMARSISPAIVVSFGSPRLLDRFKEAEILIAAYDPSPEAEEAVFRCITGERPFEGRLPVNSGLSEKERKRTAP